MKAQMLSMIALVSLIPLHISNPSPIMNDVLIAATEKNIFSNRVVKWQQLPRDDFHSVFFSNTPGPFDSELSRKVWEMWDEERRRPRDWSDPAAQFNQFDRIAGWMQTEIHPVHYQSDPQDKNGHEIDTWLSLEESLSLNQDDCEGLEQIIYYLLLHLDCDPRRLYRTIIKYAYVHNGTERIAYHAVTLYFDDPYDPWVIDSSPNANLFNPVRRLSEPPQRTPIIIFNETEMFELSSPNLTLK